MDQFERPQWMPAQDVRREPKRLSSRSAGAPVPGRMHPAALCWQLGYCRRCWVSLIA